MKNILIVLIICTLQNSCKRSHEKIAILHGTGLDKSIKKVYLTTVPEWDVFLDSAECINGTFTINYSPSKGFEPFFASICYLDSSKEIKQFYIRNEIIMKKTKKNSSNSGFMLDYGESIFKNFDQKDGETDVTLEGGKESKLFKQYEGQSIGFIKGPTDVSGFKRVISKLQQNPDSFFLLANIIQFREQYSQIQLEQIIRTFDPTLKASEAGKFLEEYVANMPNITQKPVNLSLVSDKGIRIGAINKRRKLNMLIFWASWCGPCRAELPDLKNIKRLIKSDDFFMASISIDKDTSAWKNAIIDDKPEWDQFLVEKKDLNKIMARFQFSSIPLVIFTDSDGNELKRFDGYQPGQVPNYLNYIKQHL